MKLDNEMKKRIKESRLLEYSQRMYVLEMDITAFHAIGDTQGAAKATNALEGLQKAYAAVEAM